MHERSEVAQTRQERKLSCCLPFCGVQTQQSMHCRQSDTSFCGCMHIIITREPGGRVLAVVSSTLAIASKNNIDDGPNVGIDTDRQ